MPSQCWCIQGQKKNINEEDEADVRTVPVEENGRDAGGGWWQMRRQSRARDRSAMYVSTIQLGHTSGGRDARRSLAAATLGPRTEDIFII